MPPFPPLDSAADPILGVATGFFAYYLWETDPKNAASRPVGRSLLDVTGRWWNSTPPPKTLYVGPGPEPVGGRAVERTGVKIV
jgi:hypothetical protein